MSDIEEPPHKVTKFEMESQFLEGEVMDEGQEEWLSEGILTDDDYNPDQSTEQDSNTGNTSQDEPMASANSSMDNTENDFGSQDTIDHSMLTEQNATLKNTNRANGNIEETLNNFENKENNNQSQDLPDDLDTFLIRKTNVNVSKQDTDDKVKEKDSDIDDSTKQSDDDGNDTDDLLRMLGEGDDKSNKNLKDEESTDYDDDDEYIYEGSKFKTLTVAKNALMMKYPAAKAEPEIDDDMTDVSSDEGDTVKKMFGVQNSKNTKSSSVTSKASSNTSKHSTITSKPSKITSKPSSIMLKPSTITSKPSTITSTPNTITSKPSKITSKPSTITSTPTSITSKPSTITSKPNLINSKLRTITSKSSTITSKPSLIMSKPSPITSKPSPITSKPSNIATKDSAKSSMSPSDNQLKKTMTKQVVNVMYRPQIEKANPPPKSATSPKQYSNRRVQLANQSKTGSQLKTAQPVTDSQQKTAKPLKTVAQQNNSLLRPSSKVVTRSRAVKPEVDEIIDEEEFLEDDDFDLDEDFTERSPDSHAPTNKQEREKQRIMRPEEMDEEVPTDGDSDTDEESLYDELPSSDSENLDEWFTLDIRAERAGDYLPLLGDKAYKLLTEEKLRVSERLSTLKKSLSALTDTGKQQAEQLRKATVTLAELDTMLKAA